jgi:hypothetical protein
MNDVEGASDSNAGGPRFVARVPPRRLLAEGATIMTSILLALAVNAWWDNHKERVSEHEFLVRAAEEFAENDRLVTAAVKARREIMAAADSFLNLAAGPTEAGAAVVVPGATLGQLLTWYTLDPVNANTASLIESGELRQIRDDSLRILIASWPDVIRDVNEDEVVDRDLLQTQLLPQLYPNMPPVPAYGLGGRPDTRMQVTRYGYNLVNRRRVAALQIISDLEEASRRVTRIRGLIEKNLKN